MKKVVLSRKGKRQNRPTAKAYHSAAILSLADAYPELRASELPLREVVSVPFF